MVQTITDIDFGATPQAEVVPDEKPAALPATLAPEAATIFSIIERAARDPTVNIDKMERLIAMQERMQAQRAKLEYDNAMSYAQKEMQPVRADAYNKQTQSKYASYHALDDELRPIYTRHGFSLSFGTAVGAPENCVRICCTIAHISGHREERQLDMPADGKGAKGGDVMTRTHATGAAITYGKRYLLSMIFNIAVSFEDDDGNGAGGNHGSWGPGGKHGAIDQARADGLMANAPKASAEQIRNMHRFIANAKSTLQLSGQTPDSIGQFWMNCRKRREQIEECLPTEYADLEKVYSKTLSDAQARM